VDKGAENAVKNRMGLLPPGYLRYRDVRQGDIVDIESNGKVFAKGITDYTSSELNMIKGKHSDMIEKTLDTRIMTRS